MTEQSVDLVISMGIADRQRSMNFYLAAFDFELIGEPVQDGVPEPLQFQLNDHTRLMLIPNDGFDWVLDKHTNAPSGVSESIPTFTRLNVRPSGAFRYQRPRRCI